VVCPAPRCIVFTAHLRNSRYRLFTSMQTGGALSHYRGNVRVASPGGAFARSAVATSLIEVRSSAPRHAANVVRNLATASSF